MKTTVEISDNLFRQVKKTAADQGISFRQAVETGLRRWLNDLPQKEPFRLRKRHFRGNGLQQDFSWEQIRDLIYEDRG